MSDVLLDTHAAIWLLEGSERPSSRAKTAIETAETVCLSDVSLLEIAMLAHRGKISFTSDTAQGLKEFSERLTVLPITSSIAADSAAVALPHRDPFDRIIAATARVHDLHLITKDKKIVQSGVAKTIWQQECPPEGRLKARERLHFDWGAQKIVVH